MSKEIYMDDVKDIALQASDLIKERFKQYGIELNDEQDDSIYVPLCDSLEKIANYPDYRNYN